MASPNSYFRAHAQAEPWHVERFCRSWEWIESLPGHNLLDAGGEGVLTRFLREQGYTITNTTTDLRYPLPLPEATFDGVLCTEVIEHIKDQDGSGNLATFDASGIRCCLAELRRVCKPGGWLFLSTPNVACYRALQLIMQGRHPFMFQPHHRELAPGDVRGYIEGAGWTIERAEVLSVWNDHNVTPAEKEAFSALAQQLYGDGSPIYGDSIFMVARC